MFGSTLLHTFFFPVKKALMIEKLLIWSLSLLLLHHVDYYCQTFVIFCPYAKVSWRVEPLQQVSSAVHSQNLLGRSYVGYSFLHHASPQNCKQLSNGTHCCLQLSSGLLTTSNLLLSGIPPPPGTCPLVPCPGMHPLPPEWSHCPHNTTFLTRKWHLGGVNVCWPSVTSTILPKWLVWYINITCKIFELSCIKMYHWCH